MLKASLILATLVSAASFTPAFATVGNVRTIATADLNLASAAGRARLDQRLKGAVSELCGTAVPADLAGRDEIRRCRIETLAAIGHPHAR